MATPYRIALCLLCHRALLQPEQFEALGLRAGARLRVAVFLVAQVKRCEQVREPSAAELFARLHAGLGHALAHSLCVVRPVHTRRTHAPLRRG
jgi:hypothetical protein